MDDLIDVRQSTHGDAWLRSGEAIKPLLPQVAQLPPFAFTPWVMIFVKLVRILYNPTYPDHWADVAGYAHLVIKHLGEKNEIR